MCWSTCPDEDVFARMGTAVGGSLDAWREARQLIGDDLIRVIRQGGWDFDLVDDDALAVLPADRTRPVIIAGATALPAEVQAWFEGTSPRGGTVITVDSAWTSPARRPAGVADVAAVLSAFVTQPDVRGATHRTPEVGVAHRQTADADVYLVINTGPSAGPCHPHAACGPRLVRGVGRPDREVVRTGRLG